MKFLFVLLFLSVFTIDSFSQAYLKTEYIGSSNYRDMDNNKTGGKGVAKIVSGGIQIPFSIKMSEDNRPIVWGIGIGGSYTSFDNKNLPEYLCPPEILNGQIALMHMRPISSKWSVMASLGVGVYTAHVDLSKIRMKNVLGSGGVIFIYRLKDNLDLGAGLAVNTSFGYPMAFPALYLNWSLSGRYEVKVSMMNAFEILAGMELHKNFKLSVVGEASGSLALENVDGKDMMFSHQYVVAGLRPEFIIGKSLSIPVTVGVSAYRPAFYTERSLKAFFKAMDRDNDPNFSVAPYASAAIKYKF